MSSSLLDLKNLSSISAEPASAAGAKVGVCVVGCGYWGPNLMRNFHGNAGAELRWVVDLQPERLEPFRGRYPEANFTTTLEEALADPQVAAVVIATPVSTHFPLARACLTAGRHVLLEKPMARSVAECDELIALAAKRRLVLMVDHTFIYTTAVRKIREMIDGGELGEIYYFDSVRVNLGLFQHDINVLWDLAPHDLSIMDYVLKKRPVAVAAHGACHVPGSDLENIAYLTLRFEDDTIAHFHVNWLAPAKIRRIVIGGTKKMLIFDDLSPDEKLKIYDKGLVLKDGIETGDRQVLSGYRIGDLHVPHLIHGEALALEVDHFLDCVRHEKTPQSDGQAGRRVVATLEAAQKSLQQKGELIPL